MAVRLVDANLTNEQLAQQAQQGCDASFELLVKRCQAPLLHFLQSRAVSFDDAGDLLHETVIRVSRHLAWYQSKLRFSTELFTTACQLMASHFRDTRPHAGAEVMLALPSSLP